MWTILSFIASWGGTHQLPSVRELSPGPAASRAISGSTLVAENFAAVAEGRNRRRPAAQQRTKARHRAST